jgi:site-specific recombinase XerD
MYPLGDHPGEIRMPRLTQSVPKYRKHAASQQAFVELAGHRHYLGPHGTKASRIEYDRLISEWLHNGRQVSPRPAHDGGAGELTMIQLIAAYLRVADRYYRKNGERTSEYAAILQALRYVKRLYGRQPVREFGPLRLQSVIQEMVRAGWARNTINKQAGRIKRMFRWAVSQELITADLAQALASVSGLRMGRTEARESRPVLPIDDRIIELTIVHLPEVVADMVMLQRLSGMRPAEVCILRPMDINRSNSIWTYSPESHKTQHWGRQRVVYLGPKAQRLLLKYLVRNEADYCFRPCESEVKRRAAKHATRKVPLHRGNRPGTNRKARPRRSPGEHYDTNAFRRAVNRGCDRAFPHPTLSTLKRSQLTSQQVVELRKWQSEHRWAPNRVRHTTATQVRKEFGLEFSQVILGHANAETAEIYAQQDAAKGIEVARRIG